MADFVSRQRNSFQLLTARYRNSLNFATPTEHDVQEHLLERLMVAFLQIEVNTLYVMKSQGRIPYRKVGHLLRFDFEEIVEWTKPKAQ